MLADQKKKKPQATAHKVCLRIRLSAKGNITNITEYCKIMVLIHKSLLILMQKLIDKNIKIDNYKTF